MSTKIISLRIDERLLSILVNRAAVDSRSVSNTIINIIQLNGCLGCPYHTKTDNTYVCAGCNNRELSGFISIGNPIPNWCPLNTIDN